MHYSNTYSNDDVIMMTRALELANSSMYISMPNPRVGCVLVKNGNIIGEGFTQIAGYEHAEIQALRDASNKNIDTQGAVAYVTLEPCNYVGRTPACTEALVKAGIKKVIAAMKDPNPRVSGNGFNMLCNAGIEVRYGLLEKLAYELNIGFIKRMNYNLPWVRLKIASSIDGRIALSNGQSKWLSSTESLIDVHHWRARACVILTGKGTVLSDNPQLNVRNIINVRQPQRILLDSNLLVSPSAKIFNTNNILVIHASTSADVLSRANKLRNLGIEVICLPNKIGCVDLQATLNLLNKREVNEIHLEAGCILNGSWLTANLVDELIIYLTPSLIGNKGIGMFNLPNINNLEKRIQMDFFSIKTLGRDLRIILRRKIVQ